jgi:hypothetical protein
MLTTFLVLVVDILVTYHTIIVNVVAHLLFLSLVPVFNDSI